MQRCRLSRRWRVATTRTKRRSRDPQGRGDARAEARLSQAAVGELRGRGCRRVTERMPMKISFASPTALDSPEHVAFRRHVLNRPNDASRGGGDRLPSLRLAVNRKRDLRGGAADEGRPVRAARRTFRRRSRPRLSSSGVRLIKLQQPPRQAGPCWYGSGRYSASSRSSRRSTAPACRHSPNCW